MLSSQDVDTLKPKKNKDKAGSSKDKYGHMAMLSLVIFILKIFFKIYFVQKYDAKRQRGPAGGTTKRQNWQETEKVEEIKKGEEGEKREEVFLETKKGFIFFFWIVKNQNAIQTAPTVTMMKTEDAEDRAHDHRDEIVAAIEAVLVIENVDNSCSNCPLLYCVLTKWNKCQNNFQKIKFF